MLIIQYSNDIVIRIFKISGKDSMNQLHLQKGLMNIYFSVINIMCAMNMKFLTLDNSVHIMRVEAAFNIFNRQM